MGTPAYVNQGTISFNNPEAGIEAFDTIRDWVTKAMSSKLQKEVNGDYGIYNLELADSKKFITFTAESGRYQNLQWQMETFLSVCKPLKDIDFFDAPIMIYSEDGVFWDANVEKES